MAAMRSDDGPAAELQPAGRLRRGPSRRTTFASATLAVVLLASITAVPLLGADRTMLGPDATEPPLLVDGVPITELPPAAVVRVTPDSQEADPETALAAMPGVQSVRRVTDDTFGLVGVDAEEAAGWDIVASAQEEVYGQLAGAPAPVLLAAEPDPEPDPDPVPDEPAPADPTPVDPGLAELAASEPAFGSQWHLDNQGQRIDGTDGSPGADIGWLAAASERDGEGVLIAVIDGPIDVTHPDLTDSIYTNPGEVCGSQVDSDGNGFVDDCAGWDFVDWDPTPGSGADPTRAHGTHVAGIIAARFNGAGTVGVAPGARILPLKIAENGAFPISRAAEAIHYALSFDADIIVTSWGTEPGVADPEVLREAVEAAAEAGVLIVAAAGNAGVDIDERPVYPASYASYAFDRASDGGQLVPLAEGRRLVSRSNVIAVAATDNRDRLASFSNRGRRTIAVAAPGVNILSTLPGGGYGWYSGTSMAAPVVAGVAAMLLEYAAAEDGPAPPPGALATRIEQESVTLLNLRSSVRSAGRVSAVRALGITERVSGDLVVTASGLPNTSERWLREGGLAQAGEGPGGELVLQGVQQNPLSVALEIASPVPDALRLSLGRLHDDAVHAVTGHFVEVKVRGKQAIAPTNGIGSVRLPVLDELDRAALQGDGVTMLVDTELPDGHYALMVDVPSKPELRPAVVLFTVGFPPLLDWEPPIVDGGDSGGGGGGTTPPDGPGTGDGTTPPGDPGTGDDTTPPDDSGTGDDTTPPGGGTTPPGDTGGTTPPDGGTTPPGDTGGTTPPDGGTTPPGDTGGTTPPGDTGGTTPPGGGTTPPGDTGGTTPPGDGDGDDALDPPGKTSSVQPAYGTPGTPVSIWGPWPQGPQVTFGGVRAYNMYSQEGVNVVIVTAPPHAPGVVDVTVADPDGRLITTFPQAFRYIDSSTDGGTTPDDGSGGAGDGSGGTGDGSGGGGGSGDGSGGGSGGGTPGSGSGDGPPTPAPGDDLTDAEQPLVAGQPVEVDGLLLDRYTDAHPFGGLDSSAWMAACRVEPCHAIRP